MELGFCPGSSTSLGVSGFSSVKQEYHHLQEGCWRIKTGQVPDTHKLSILTTFFPLSHSHFFSMLPTVQMKKKEWLM